MAAAFLPSAFLAPHPAHARPRAWSPRRPQCPSTVRRRAAVRCCVESPAWKNVPVDIDFAKDDQLQLLEAQLDVALDAEDFAQASVVRDKLLRLQSGAYVSVLTTNLKFYKAFERGSIVDMAGVWLQDGSVVCKHPMGPLCVGYINIINSFGAFFSYGVPVIAPKNVVITMRGSCAWVTCDEHCHVVEEVEGVGEDGEKVVERKTSEVVMTATNIFVKRNGQWYLTHHTSQPIYAEA